MANCIVCGQTRISQLLNLDRQPLSTVNLPKTKEAAQVALRYPLNFHVCTFCGHVFNVEFDDTRIAYAEDSYHMYNSGAGWQTHIAEVIGILTQYNEWQGKNAIDIGCGTGDFFTAMLKRFPQETFIGFEPGIEADRIDAFPVERDYFEPERDLKLYKPGLLCIRHVLEHLKNPREFLAEIAYWCEMYRLSPYVYVEVPCFDKALRMGRVGDLIYEHASHFTESSFWTIFQAAGLKLMDCRMMYDDEVISGLALPDCNDVRRHEAIASKFHADVRKSQVNMLGTLSDIVGENKRVALWGGTGKSAAFINTYGLDAENFPLVVDSDEEKCGKFVPGTGQEIVHSTALLDLDVDVIVITTRWRAADIHKEIVQRNIPHKRVMYLNGTTLIDYKGE